MQLKDRVAMVTGGGSGIGKASAILFAKNGAKVGVLSHSDEQIDKTVKEIHDHGGVAMPIVADISHPQQMEHAYKQLVERYGKLDIVFANAGINGVWAPVEELEVEEWNKTININLTGTFLTIKYAVPHLKKNGSGSIIVTSSINGTRIFMNTGATAYSTSKAGQLAMAQMLALELAPSNIRVNVICPGSIKTEINQNTVKRDLDKVKIPAKYGTEVPLSGKPGTSDEVAELALFLASDQSRHISGTPIWIDGAQSLLKG
jgi:NAD(P)-dependent dehydrogenase (short-subunit alcohol dehydrogenase family)